ncbi:hypothetical protein L3Q82_012717, partial [Scortum barcoo]
EDETAPRHCLCQMGTALTRITVRAVRTGALRSSPCAQRLLRNKTKQKNQTTDLKRERWGDDSSLRPRLRFFSDTEKTPRMLPPPPLSCPGSARRLRASPAPLPLLLLLSALLLCASARPAEKKNKASQITPASLSEADQSLTEDVDVRVLLSVLQMKRCVDMREKCVFLNGNVIRIFTKLSSRSLSRPGDSKCPGHLDCAKERRHFCRPGSSRCGPCLSSLEENEEGRCVLRKMHQQQGKVAFDPDLDEEIDYFHSVAKQHLSEIKTPQKQFKHPALINFQTDVKKTRTDASKLKQKSQIQPSIEPPLATSTSAPAPSPSALPNTPTPQPRATGVGGRDGPIAVHPALKNDSIFVIMISLCVLLGAVAVVLATVCFVKLQKESRLAQKVDYPAFGGAGAPAAAASGTSNGDKTLAQSAQMYHYQHQKQQILSAGNHKPEQKVLDTEVTSDEEEVGGDFTVYECPGLAPTGEMEVKNPLFDDSTLNYQGTHK